MKQRKLKRVINALDETLLEDLASMKPQERAILWKDLQEYITPKLARTELKLGIVTGKQIGRAHV